MECIASEQIPYEPFMCTSTGYFPSLANCRDYYICYRPTPDSALATSYYRCPGGYYFDAHDRSCRRQLLSRECTRRVVNCQGMTTAEPVRYAPTPRYYYFCNPANNKLVLFKCPHNSQYDSFSVECKYNCWRPGNFPYSDNPSWFFVCYRESMRLTSRVERCPIGFKFNPHSSRCQENGNPSPVQ